LDLDHGLQLYDAANGGHAMLIKSVPPSTPYYITAFISLSALRANNRCPGGGIGWRDSDTGKHHSICGYIDSNGQPNLAVQNFSNASTFISNDYDFVYYPMSRWYKLIDTGSTVYFQVAVTGSD